MTKLIQDMAAYFASNGTLTDVYNFSQMVASGAWGDIRHLANILGL